MKERFDIALITQTEEPGDRLKKLPDEDNNGYFQRLIQELNVPRDKRGRISWTNLRRTPEKLELFVELSASAFVENGVLTEKILVDSGRRDLNSGVVRFYPGGRNALTDKLGLSIGSRPRYWTPEVIEKKAREFIESNGGLTQRLLYDRGLSGLSYAIQRYFPGGMLGFKNLIGITINSRPPGFWTEEEVEKEAADFFQENGGLTHPLLAKNSRHDLIGGIAKYPGNIIGLKRKLRIDFAQQQSGYWRDIESIEREARDFYFSFGGLSHRSLNAHRKFSLRHAINKYYPGGIRSLKDKLGIESKIVKPYGYWTREIIEEEASAFLQIHGRLTVSGLHLEGRGDLLAAIGKFYPGGISALKEKLGITEANQEPPISPDQANEQLAKLMEVAK